ncbi:MAG: DHHW family protein [Clostridia bacterium]|nr:DHHW family protein [Clostridia bacterium]
MEKKKVQIPLTVWAFLGVIAILTVANLFSPDRAFSAAENRVLDQKPPFSLRALLLDEPGWTLQFEEYFTDQFVHRDVWVGMKASAERAAGKKENGGVYLAKKDYLIEKPAAITAVDANVKSVNRFALEAGVPVYVALLPNSICIYDDLLPRYAADGAQEQVIADAYAALANVTPIELAPVMRAHSGEYIYYRTDHHPTSLGAYYAYTALAQGLGFAPNALDSYTRERVSESFCGTTRARSGAWWVQPDTIELFSHDDACTLTTFEEGAATTQDGVYVRENLAKQDQYTVFLGGNHPRQIIEREGTGKKLLLIKDSFAHCVAPFLTAHYKEIHLLDMRYYRDPVQDYVRKNGIDEVLILYSVNNFETDRNMVFLNR